MPLERARAAERLDAERDFLALGALSEHVANGLVSELVIVEVQRDVYRLEALLTWQPRRSVLGARRGGARVFRNVGTLVKLCREIGAGRTSIRMELKQ